MKVTDYYEEVVFIVGVVFLFSFTYSLLGLAIYPQLIIDGSASIFIISSLVLYVITAMVSLGTMVKWCQFNSCNTLATRVHFGFVSASALTSAASLYVVLQGQPTPLVNILGQQMVVSLSCMVWHAMRTCFGFCSLYAGSGTLEARNASTFASKAVAPTGWII